MLFPGCLELCCVVLLPLLGSQASSIAPAVCYLASWLFSAQSFGVLDRQAQQAQLDDALSFVEWAIAPGQLVYVPM
jgi:hypothetical protein